jgi:hypothetical protein
MVLLYIMMEIRCIQWDQILYFINNKKAGNLGLSYNYSVSTPTPIPVLSNTPINLICTGVGFAYALTQDLRMFSWGLNNK